jgi:hypothetical protein
LHEPSPYQDSRSTCKFQLYMLLSPKNVTNGCVIILVISHAGQGNDVIGHFFCLRFVATMDDDNGFLKGKFPGDCFANPSAAAGDQCLLTAQAKVHVPVPFYIAVNFVR